MLPLLLILAAAVVVMQYLGLSPLSKAKALVKRMLGKDQPPSSPGTPPAAGK